MSDVFDNLVISLCKFTTLLTAAAAASSPASAAAVSSSVDPQSSANLLLLPVVFGGNEKALAATRTVFSLVQRHGDILRDGWKNVVECLLQLFKCR